MKHPARIDAYKAGGAEPPLPPLSVRYHYDWLMEIGPTESGAMGKGPISWQAIRAWRLETQTPLAPWESRLLRRLSKDFLTESQAAEDPHRAAPWHQGPAEVDHEANERQLRAVLG